MTTDSSHARHYQSGLKPQKLDNTLAFMVESRLRFIPTTLAMQAQALNPDYPSCWSGLKDHFQPPKVKTP